MGTRSTIHVYEGKQHVVGIYNQYDGYLSGIGGDLYEFLSKGRVVNGFNPSVDKLNFNGAGCLAAKLVANFKEGTGGCYITDKKDRQEYNYFIYVNNDQITIKVTDWGNKFILKKGNISDLLNLCIEDGYKPKTELDLVMGAK